MSTNPPTAARQFILPLAHELIVDLFAGGGGTSTGIEQALGRHVDVAVNHDADAIALHEANHPQTRHFHSDIWEVDPLTVVDGRPVGLMHASPDCTHHSQARGGQPRDAKIRALAWVVHRWAGTLRQRGKGPRVITLENVEQMLQWSPLVAKRCPKTGRVVRLDGTVAEPGGRTPLNQQFLVPDPKRRSATWEHFVAGLRAIGYAVQWRVLVAADFGAPTTRKRLFLIARCDGQPIVWPTPTHAAKPAKGLKRWRSAAECIDWSIPCPSIFDRKKSLAEATHRRIAKGIRKYVLDAAAPFIVPITHTGGDRLHGIDEPLRTVTTAHRGEFALVTGTMVQAAHGEGSTTAPRWGQGCKNPAEPLGTITASGSGGQALAAATLVQMGFGEREGQAPRALNLEAPLGTVTAGGIKHAVVTAFMAQHNTDNVGHPMEAPVSTIIGKGCTQGLVAALLSHAYTSNTCGGEGDPTQPAKTITTGGHHALIECSLSQDDEAGALRVSAFLMRYYGEGGQLGDLAQPAATITTKERLALVTVTIKGAPYVIVDIGLRMLTPRELYTAQGFPREYVIDRRADGQPLTKGSQVRMVGNSVSPPPMEAIVRANYAVEQQQAVAA